MPRIDSAFFRNNLEKKNLIITLDENESIIQAIKQAMMQYKIKEVKIEDINGSVKEALISFMDGPNYRSKKLVDRELLRAAGNFKLSFDELFGVMNISTKGKPPLSGTLVTGKAKQGLEIKLSFFEEK